MLERLYKGFVRTKDKNCIDKFKNGAKLRTFDEVKNLDEYAGILADDVIFVDIDDMNQSEIMMDIVEDLQLDCIVYQTTRGRHFLFKNNGVDKCGTHKKIAIGLTADIKVGSRNSYEIIKFNGEERFVEWDCEELGTLPKWFVPVNSNIDFFDMKEGQGRNQALFNYILTLTSAGFTQEESRECIRLINKYVLHSPLSEDELNVIIRDEAFPEETFYDGKKFLHNNFAVFLKNNDKICRINGQLHVYRDGQYIAGHREIESIMLKYVPTLKSAQRVEVLKYLELICNDVVEADARFIAFNNGVYDIMEGVLKSFTSDLIITNKIPWDYDETAYSELCDNVLNKLSCNDKAIRMLLEEAIGYSFYRRNELSKAFFLTGEGANGKSTFLDMLKNLLGQINYSSLDLAELEERFSIVTLSGKLANVGDDISDDFLQGRAISTFKKIVSGNQVKAENKGVDAFFFNPYTKLYFSANSLPRTKSKGFGAILRRLVIIPFNGRFTKDDPDYDPFITWKLKDEKVMKYLIQLGIQGLKRVLENRGFTESKKVEKELKEYEISNNPILLWLQEDPKVENEPTKEVHRNYRSFCIENGFTEMTLMNFSKEINKRLGLTVVRRRIDGKLTGIYVKE